VKWHSPIEVEIVKKASKGIFPPSNISLERIGDAAENEQSGV
jgi:hypothetical protein